MNKMTAWDKSYSKTNFVHASQHVDVMQSIGEKSLNEIDIYLSSLFPSGRLTDTTVMHSIFIVNRELLE